MRLFTIMIVFFFSNTTVYFVFASEMLLSVAANREDRENILSLILSPFSFSFPFH